MCGTIALYREVKTTDRYKKGNDKMFESHLFARCTAHHAVLYWDKPAAAGAQAEYTVYLNNEPV